MENWPPKALPQHDRLKEKVGTWDVDCSYFMGPDQPPMRVRARETIEILGPFWTVGRFSSNMMGVSFTGEAVIGYDPGRGRWVGTWIDTLTPYYYFFEGDFDAAGKVLEMSGEGGDPSSGRMARYRTTETFGEGGQRVFEMFMDTPDGEIKILSYVCARASKKSAGRPTGTTRARVAKTSARPARRAAAKSSGRAAKARGKAAKSGKKKSGAKKKR